uniref:Uncharacterized protein LOC111136650 isoform X2 n=1 Tax=Crassostrea virginica TaxID=6565 RepID=A0A8B8ETS4_CRAVI|nr:uncharacterized protein LOC111136650 isoform X2 [Crassostrea virginica]
MSDLFRDDHRRRVIQDNLVELADRLCPEELLPHLPCLSKTSKQKIVCRLEQRGQQAASLLLLDDLPRKDRWWEQLLAALRHPSVGMKDLAESLQRKEEAATGARSQALETSPPYRKVPQTKRRPMVDWSTPFGDLMPFSVVIILSRLDMDSRWKELAAYLEYTMEEVNSFETYTQDRRYIESMCRDLKSRPDITLGHMIDLLKIMERIDLLEELQRVKELKHLDWSNKLQSTLSDVTTGEQLEVNIQVCDSVDSSQTNSTRIDEIYCCENSPPGDQILKQCNGQGLEVQEDSASNEPEITVSAPDFIDSAQTNSQGIQDGCGTMPPHTKTKEICGGEGKEVNEDSTNSSEIPEDKNTVSSNRRDSASRRVPEVGGIGECSLVKIGTAVGLAAAVAALLYRS